MDSPRPAVIETPCLKVCAVNGMTNQCIGCGRTLAEIGGWTRFTDAERRAIMALTQDDAKAAGIDVRNLRYDARVRTASGTARA
ncbi:MAG: DUF1289 domain-containing protein, partial [Alphaproteobacteria bacterium]|nr:DUF1289 domain-containing protein [Alphaproteobacteria bacterium]